MVDAVAHFLILTLISVLPMIARQVVCLRGAGPRTVYARPATNSLVLSVKRPRRALLLRRRPRRAAGNGARVQRISGQPVFLCWACNCAPRSPRHGRLECDESPSNVLFTRGRARVCFYGAFARLVEAGEQT